MNDVEVGALPEAVAFTPDGKYVYVGNYSDRDFSILRVDRNKVADTGKHFKVPGQPGPVRMSPHRRTLSPSRLVMPATASVAGIAFLSDGTILPHPTFSRT